MTLAESDVFVRRDPYRFGEGPDPVLQPGTVGWTAEDLIDPSLRRQWEAGRFEIVDGVLTVMPPAFYVGGNVVDNLKRVLCAYCDARQMRVSTSSETHIVVNGVRVAMADGVAVLGEQLAKLDSLVFDPPGTTWKHHPLTVPPTIVIESVSEGHEAHDRVTKRRWYADLGVPNYWIVDGYARTLECLRLSPDGQSYDVDASGKGDDVLAPTAFPGLTIPLRWVWET
jgi:Uma2 family endonuclease